jgi:nucleotide-binding universal stress UspA family protein
MFKNLLVPLDGSSLAESALTVARFLALNLGASVTLLHIIERDAPAAVHSERHLTNSEEALVYLDGIAGKVFPAEVVVKTHVHTVEVKDVAQSIADHSEELGPDLIIMCTHGRSGAKEWLFGSIAQQVISIGELPLLLIPPKCCRSEFLCRMILVPLDGHEQHEIGLPMAIGLAHIHQGSVYLLMVIPTPGKLKGERAAVRQLLPGTTSVLLDIQEQQGSQYLAKLIEGIRNSEIDLQAGVARGDPVSTIIDTADRIDADLVVLGTHAKTGADAFWSGSATPKISSRSRIPLLLVPIKDA